jgi:adenylate cyclase
MEADEAATLATMKAHRQELWTPKVQEHGGRVVGTAGDSILVEFASAVAAVECAVAVQQGMEELNTELPEERRMLLRVGINIGEVVVDGEDIYGDGVNVAARLEALADPGGICVSDDLYRQVVGKTDFSFEDAGEHKVKNIARPIQVWRWSETGSTGTMVTGSESLPLPDKPSIAVLSFDNMSGDPEQEYFTDGIVEDIITELSREPDLFVIARNSSLTSSSSPATPASPTRVRARISAKSPANWACATCWKAACARPATASASTLSSSRRRPAITSEPNATTGRWRTCSRSRTNSPTRSRTRFCRRSGNPA